MYTASRQTWCRTFKWSNDLRKTTGRSWMRETEDRGASSGLRKPDDDRTIPVNLFNSVTSIRFNPKCRLTHF